MITSPYKFIRQKYYSEQDIVVFSFISRGRRHILKEVAFTPIELNGEKYYNWGFGDVEWDKNLGWTRLSDSVNSNNGDLLAVMYTVISTLSVFFKTHPTATVHLLGSDEKRTRIYHGILKRHREEIEKLYKIQLLLNGTILISKK